MWSAIYLVGTQFMDPKYRRFFQTEGDVSGLDWPAESFYQVYSRYFADEDYYMANAGALGAALRPMIQTIEIADDDLEMTWADFIQFQTGYPLRVPGAEILSFRIGRMGRRGTYTYENNTAYNHFYKGFKHTVRKNHLMQEGGCLIHVAGNWSNPLVDGDDRDAGFDINLLTNRDDWMIKSMDAVSDQVGKLSATEAAINLFYGGDIYVPNRDNLPAMNIGEGDLDPDTLGGSAESESGGPSNAGATETTNFLVTNEFSLGASYLSGITFI